MSSLEREKVGDFVNDEYYVVCEGSVASEDFFADFCLLLVFFFFLFATISRLGS